MPAALPSIAISSQKSKPTGRGGCSRRGRRRARRARPSHPDASGRRGRVAAVAPRRARGHAAAVIRVTGGGARRLSRRRLAATSRAAVRREASRCVQEANPAAEHLVAHVEAHLREHPEDGRGWDVLAPVYMRLQRLQAGANAFSRAIALLGETPQAPRRLRRVPSQARWRQVTDEAREAFEKVRKGWSRRDRGTGLARPCARAGRRSDGAAERVSRAPGSVPRIRGRVCSERLAPRGGSRPERAAARTSESDGTARRACRRKRRHQ